MGSNIVRLGAQPTEIKLRFEPSAGEKVPSQFREYDFLHHVNDGQLVYLDPQAHSTLLQLGASAGDLVRLTKMRRGKETYIDVALASDAAEPPPAPPVKAAPPIPATILNGQLHERPAPPPAPVVAPALEENTLARPAAETLKGAGFATIDAVIAIEEYARVKGRPTTFSEESIRAMLLSVYIGAEKRGNR